MSNFSSLPMKCYESEKVMHWTYQNLKYPYVIITTSSQTLLWCGLLCQIEYSRSTKLIDMVTEMYEQSVKQTAAITILITVTILSI